MDNKNVKILNAYERNGKLTLLKLKEYLPAMIVTNLSALLLITVDGIVVGNFAGEKAFSSVSLFSPITLIIGVISTLVSIGISTCMSTSMGGNDKSDINRVKGASFWLMIYMTIFVAVAQIPVIWIFIKAYGLSGEMYSLTWQYAIGLMISFPFGFISTVGTIELQITGKMKMLMKLSIMEGIINLVLDLLFVGAFKMGVAGAGYGTACANVARCSVTVLFLSKYTDIYYHKGYKKKVSDYIEILRYGVPEALDALISALEGYILVKIMLSVFGEDAGTINGVCIFCGSLANVLIGGITGSMRPMVGLLAGAGDKKGLNTIMQQGKKVSIALVGGAIALMVIIPEVLYSINGVKDIPDYGIASVRLKALSYMFVAFNALLRLYLVNRKDAKYTAKTVLFTDLSLPVFAYILAKILPPPFIYVSYSLSFCLTFIFYYKRYLWWREQDRIQLENTPDEVVLYMSVDPENAVYASRELRKYADELGIDVKISYRIALCMEEMVAYANAVNDKGISVQVMIRFEGKDKATFVMMDNGKCIALDKMEDSARGVITDNYVLLQKSAKSIEYQYVLDLNYTILNFAA
ncbi:MAG: polysaccharide biosynthesis C-terminal domain-containing protein [Eubacterium sp.]|nr:polysaccharide biosynthesis C-terminal domain-containing protein [Eubacterium sp.]